MNGLNTRILLEVAEKFGTPVYLYDAEKVREKARSVREAVPFEPFQPLYACKANSNPHIIRLLLDAGYGIDATSPGEVHIALKAGCPPDKIILTGSNLSEDDFRYALDAGVTVNLDSLSQIESFGSLGAGRKVWLRYNPKVGAGESDKVITAGPESKFGIRDSDFDDALRLAERHALKVSGLHMHIGSMIMSEEPLLDAFARLLARAREIDTLEALDAGGGIGVPYRDEDPTFPLEKFGKRLTRLLERFNENRKQKITLFLECGRFIVAEAGYFLCRVTALKETKTRLLVGVDTGFTHFPRPAIYDAFHKVTLVPLREEKRTETLTCAVVGNICESTDVLAKSVELPEPQVGDLLVFHTAGAYCFSMASLYNARPLPSEALVDGDDVLLIRERTTFDGLLSGVPPVE